MSEPVFVGCDMGTTVTKAAVVDLSGRILAEAAEETHLITPRPGWVEQDLTEIETVAHRVIAAAVAASGRREDIAGFACSSQMSGIGTIDEHFEPATRFDSWLDSRCTPYIEEMAEHAERVTELSGCPPTYSHGPKIMWWQRERPDDYRRVARFVVPGSFVAARLGGLPVEKAFVDRTYLCFSNLSDTAASEWSPELLDAFGVEEDKLPRIVDPLDVVGQITPAASRATGIPVGVPVAAGGGDQTVACLGAGLVTPGQASDSAGTASLFSMCVDRFAPDVANGGVIASHSIVPGGFISFAFINGGGLAMPWFRDKVVQDLGHGDEAYASLEALAAEVEPGAGNLLWLPHLGGGVLPPRPHLRGSWFGLTPGHGRGHLYRAILEGIAMVYADWAQYAPALFGGEGLREVRAFGGGSRSPLWGQIKADVLGVPFVTMPRSECAMLGNALIAAAATGHVDDIGATIGAWHAPGPATQPDLERHERYRALVEVHRELAAVTDPVFARLDALAQNGSRVAT
jgi:xylulokinase